MLSTKLALRLALHWQYAWEAHRTMSHDYDLEWILRQDGLKPMHESEFHDRLTELQVQYFPIDLENAGSIR